MAICKEIDAYIRYVRIGEVAVCEEQLLLCDFVEKVFREEDVYVDKAQLKRCGTGLFGLNKNIG